jgi:hypothetical protein
VLTFLLTLLAFIAVCVALYYFWRQVLAVVIVLTLFITLAVGGVLAYMYCSDHDCSQLRFIGWLIVVSALVGGLGKAYEAWTRKRWIEEQVREGAGRFREANPGDSSTFYLHADGFKYTWDERAKKVLRRELSADDRNRIEHMERTGKTVSRLWKHTDGRTYIEYGEDGLTSRPEPPSNRCPTCGEEYREQCPACQQRRKLQA